MQGSALEERGHGHSHGQEAGVQEHGGSDRREHPTTRAQDRRHRELGRNGEADYREHYRGENTPTKGAGENPESDGDYPGNQRERQPRPHPGEIALTVAPRFVSHPRPRCCQVGWTESTKAPETPGK